MPALVGSLLLFVAVGVVFIAANLTLGRLFRPDRPDTEKGEIYECGEEAVGSAWVQFDLRFYVVALLFVIFDVEMAFFFPWAVVFGSANRLADGTLPAAERAELVAAFGADPAATADAVDAVAAGRLAWLAFGEMAVFFAILLAGFAYLWRRGDLDWVRSLLAQVRSANDRPRSTTVEATDGLARRSV
jgi:NADH-quinone oxidoreductase subunit A